MGKWLLIASTVLAVAAVLAQALVYAPFAGVDLLPAAAWLVLAVVMPYALLLANGRLAQDRFSANTNAIAAVMASALGAYAYSYAFGHMDGEYSLVFVLIPLIQSPLVLIAFAVAMWRRTRGKRAA
jgi:hypothetical protein